MICGYSNIYDYCSNKYSYEYATFVTNSKYATPNTGLNGSVYRTDKTSQEKILLQPNSNLQIYNCDTNEENPELTAWDCYLWYKNNSGVINNPPLSEYKKEQTRIVNIEYNNFLTNGILIKLDNFATEVSVSQNGAYSNTTASGIINFTILLPALHDDIINFSNTLSLASLMYTNNDPDPIPPLVDYYNNAHFLNYYNLTNILSNYFNKLKNYRLILDNLNDKISSASTIDDVQKQKFYTNLPTITYDKATDLTTTNNSIIKFSSLTCEEVNNLCDPPCDPNSCQICVSGVCISLCAGNQYCCSGICQNIACCITNGDCGNNCCVDGECVPSTDAGIYDAVSGCPNGWNYNGDVPGGSPYDIYCCPPGTTGTQPSSGKCCPII